MTVQAMRKILKGLPRDMQIVMPLGDESFITVCAENSKVVELQIDDENENDEDDDFYDIDNPVEVLLLVGCSCSIENPLEIGEINSQPELN